MIPLMYIYTFGITKLMILCTILYLFWRKAKVVWKQIIQSMIIGNVVDHWPDISENVFSNCLVTLTNDMTIGEIAHTGLLKLSQIHDMIYVLWKWFCQVWTPLTRLFCPVYVEMTDKYMFVCLITFWSCFP